MFKKYILAVSGGPDSMAMLNMYRRKAQAVCTVNYHKRKTSDYDVSVVRDFCNKHNIKLYVHDVDKKTYTKKIDNFQSFARKLRYNFFLEVAKKENNYNLLIAHNLNDFLETAYMQEQKKSKSLFYGIKQKTHYEELKIYRPLLSYQKDCLQRYCRTKMISFAIDESNDSDIYERNRVRKIIKSWSQDQLLAFIKKIKKYNKSNRHLSRKINKKYKEWKEKEYDIKFVNQQENIVRYYLIYEWLKDNDEKNNSSNKINEIIKFLENNNNSKKFRLEKDKVILKKENKARILKIDK